MKEVNELIIKIEQCKNNMYYNIFQLRKKEKNIEKFIYKVKNEMKNEKININEIILKRLSQ